MDEKVVVVANIERYHDLLQTALAAVEHAGVARRSPLICIKG